MKNIIISLFDYTGTWSKPYREAGYEVIQIDIKLGTDILTWDYKKIDKSQVYGILAACPCTDFSLSGARWWKDKDNDGSTQKSIDLVKKTLEIVKYFNPEFWVIENPLGRISRLIPELQNYRLLDFNPCEFGENYTKKTVLYGFFNPYLIRQYVEPTEGSKMWKKYGGKSERTKALRSITPEGFSKAFYLANNNLNEYKKAI